MASYFIVADDFTGANDTGVQLTRRGLRTVVVLNPDAVRYDGLSYVLDTESRNMPEEQAGEKLKRLLRNVNLRAFDCVIKKVDSTLRGNIAQELAETDRVFGGELVLFMPALPGLGRTTVGSIHYLNGTRIGDTELARDPRKPVLTDHLVEILRDGFDEEVGVLGLAEIRSGRIDLSGMRLWACDAETDQDMRAVVSAAKATGKRILWVGTAAIADHVLESDRPAKPALAVIASVSDVARKQIAFAKAKGLEVLPVDIPAILRGEDSRDYVAEAVRVLKRGRDLALVSSASCIREELDASVAAGLARGMDSEAVAEFSSSEITRMAAEILDQVSVSGLFLSGGDTAIHFFEQVGAGGSEITAELSVGIPMMRLTGGKFDGLRVITKAGAFGAEDALPAIMRKLGETESIG